MQFSRQDEIFLKILENVTIEKESGCWLWERGTSGNRDRPQSGGGYGRMPLGGTSMAVHRVVFTHFFGIIPHKKQIDHLCANRLCCNPKHLELVTHKENMKRRDNRNRGEKCVQNGTCDSYS